MTFSETSDIKGIKRKGVVKTKICGRMDYYRYLVVV